MHPFRLVHLLALALLSIAAFSSQPLRAESFGDRAVILVAHPGVRDSIWSQTVLVAVPARDGWHLGLIINRPTDRSLASLFPAHAPSRNVRDPVFLGGPTASQSLFALVKGAQSPGRDALPVAEGMYLAIDAQTIDRVIETTPAEARFFVGYVAWRPGELQREIDSGFWSAGDPDQGIIFSKDAGNLWTTLRHIGARLSAHLAR